MGFRSTFTTEDYAIAWPDWFRDKYKNAIHFPANTGPISAVREGKTYSGWSELPEDIQRVIDWTEYENFVVVFLHECGGITRCQIEAGAILWSEPDDWNQTDGVTHNYCYGCSDVIAQTQPDQSSPESDSAP